MRHEGGDGETGLGLVVGGGLSYGYAPWGLTLAASGQWLVVHEQAGYEQWGAGGSLEVDPGAPGRGLALSLSSTWGAAASGGAQWLHGLPAVTAPGAVAAGGRLAAELRYGTEVVTPYAGVEVAAPAHTWRGGGRFRLGPAFSLHLEGTRRESAAAPEHRLIGSASLRW